MNSDTAAAAMAAGRSLFHAGNFSGAERMLKQALAADPEWPGAHALLALAQYRCDRGRDALETSGQAIALAPTADAFRVRALALTLLGANKEAVVAARAAVAADPSDELARLMLGVVLEKANKLREAEAAFRQAVQLAPGNASVGADFGRFMLRNGRLKEAEALAAVIDPASDRVTVLLLRGEIALCRRRTAEARDHALWILGRDATNEAALELLTRVKASESAFLGLWWRYSLFLATKHRLIRLLVIFPALCLLVLFLGPLAFLLLLYLRISGLVFSRMLKRELKGVRLRKGF